MSSPKVVADTVRAYDVEEHIDMSSPGAAHREAVLTGNVVPVREAAGEEVFQVVVGSSANPGLRDFAVVAEIMRDHQPHDRVSLDINPSSREILEDLTKGG